MSERFKDDGEDKSKSEGVNPPADRSWRSYTFNPKPELSLRGAEGAEVAHNLILLSAGVVRPADLGPAYGIRADGAITTRVDAETAALFPWRDSPEPLSE